MDNNEVNELFSEDVYFDLLLTRNSPTQWENYLRNLIISTTVVADPWIEGEEEPTVPFDGDYHRVVDQFGVEYMINSDGLRSKPLKLLGDRPVIVGIGCSITHGIGLTPEETWIHKLAEQMDCDYINISMPGHGLTVTSLYFTDIILPLQLDIQGVFVYTPPPNRIDLTQYTNLDQSQNAVSEQMLKIRSMFCVIREAGVTATGLELIKGLEHTAFIQYTKDLRLIEANAKLHNIHYNNLDSMLFGTSQPRYHTYRKARDGEHDGAELHTDIANEFYSQLTDK